MSLQQVRLELDSNVRRTDNGTALLGGSPFRLVRLSAAGSRLLDRWLQGTNVDPREEADQLRRQLLRSGLVHPLPEAHVPALRHSFVVPVFDDASGLERLLTAIERCEPGASVVVVDDGSADEASIAEVAQRHRAELIRHDRNRGPGAARNTGWRHSIGVDPDLDIVIFIDADVAPTPKALELVLAHFEDDDVAAVAPRVRAAPGTTTIAAYEADNSPLDMGPAAALVFPGTRLSYVPSAMLAVRTSVIDDAAGLDEAMRFGEDVDFVWRLIDAGHIVRYEPRAVVEHRNRGSLTAVARQRFSYGSSAADLASKHGTKVAPLQLPAPVVAATLGLLFGRRLVRSLSLAGAALSVRPLARKFEGRVDRPWPEAARLTALMHGYALHGLVAAATRSWAPVLLAARRSRRALAVALVVPALLDWLRSTPATNPASHLAMRALDHGSYCAGVWSGVLRSRSVAALLPSVRLRDFDDD